eukprot:6204904-Pleurochrysis_carterae.AAC.3
MEPRLVDWASTDETFDDELYKLYPDVQLYPILAGAIVPIFNFSGFSTSNADTLVLSGQVLALIFCGSRCPHGIVHWDDERITLLNPRLVARGLLKHVAIHVLVRGETCGSTQIFKRSLAAFEPAFADAIGVSASPNNWPPEHGYAFQTEGLASAVKLTPYSIGYTMLEDADANELNVVAIDRGGTVVRASPLSVALALASKGANFINTSASAERLTADLHDASIPNAWPFVGYTYVVMRKDTTMVSLGQTCEARREVRMAVSFV